MRRSLGLSAIAVAALLGAGAGLTTGSAGVGPSPTPSGSASATQPTFASPASTPPSSPRTTPQSPWATTSPTTSDGSAPVTTGDLIQKIDFATAGWNTATLTVDVDTTTDLRRVGACSEISLNQIPQGSDSSAVGTYTGTYTSAEEIAHTFADPATARYAFDYLRDGLGACRSHQVGSPPDVTVGPEHVLDLGSESSRALWVTTSTTHHQDVTGAMGIVTTSDRVAVVQLYDADPQATTVDSLVRAVAARLAP